MATNDLSAILRDAPRECWLALNEAQTEVVGHGQTIQQAVDEALKNNVSDPIVIWAPKSWIPTAY